MSHEFEISKELSSIQAEKAVLGACMLDNKIAMKVALEMDDDYFYHPKTKIVFSAIKELVKNNITFDLLILVEKLNEQNKLEKLGNAEFGTLIGGGQVYIAQLLDEVSSVAHIEHYMKIVYNFWKKRKIKDACNQTNLQIEKGMDIDETMQLHLQKINLEKKERNNSTISEILSDVLENLSKKEEEGLITGFDIDYYMRMAKDRLTILAARPSMGKSTLALNIAINLSKQGKNVFFYSLEQSKEDLIEKILCRETNYKKYELKHLDKISKIVDIAKDISLWNLKIFDNAGLSVQYIQNQLKIYSINQPIDLVIVDHLGKLRSNSKRSYYEQVSEISNDLRNMANILNVPVLALAQLGRGVEQRQNKNPLMSDLRDSGKIEEDANHVLLLYRESYYTGNAYDKTVEINIAKNRHGRTGTCYLNFEPEISKFENIKKEEDILC